MKRILKWLGILLGVVLFVVMAGAAYINFAPMPSSPVKAPDLKVTADSAQIAEGRRLATLVCHQCHMSDKGILEGNIMADMPPELGKAWAPNITQGPSSRLAGYTDGELMVLLRTGVKRNGRYAPPWMPKFPHLADQELHNVIAYLRADFPELKPSEVVQPVPEPSFLAKFLVQSGVFAPLPYPEAPIPMPDTSDMVAFGKYLANGKVDCYGCHSPSFEEMNLMEPEKTKGFYSGGNAMLNLEGEVILTRNITPDKETGIGNWTEEQFVKAVKYGQRDGKPALRYPMMPMTALTDKEAAAIFAYLQTVPAIHHDVDALATK